MNKIFGIHGSNLAKELFVKALSKKIDTVKYNHFTYDFIRDIGIRDERDYPSWLISEVEQQLFPCVVIADDLCPNSLDLNWVEGYYINLIDGNGENTDGEDTYDVTINVKDEENLHSKINILLR